MGISHSEDETELKSHKCFHFEDDKDSIDINIPEVWRADIYQVS